MFVLLGIIGGVGADCHGHVQLGSKKYCTDYCRCQEQEGDCGSDEDCVHGTTCVHNIGHVFGWSRSTDVCCLHSPCTAGYYLYERACLPCPMETYNHGGLPYLETCYRIVAREITYLSTTDVMCAPGWAGIPRYEDGEYQDGCVDAGAPTFSPTHRPPTTDVPTQRPTRLPTTHGPTQRPTSRPTQRPTRLPTQRPTSLLPYIPPTNLPDPMVNEYQHKYRHVVELVAISALTLVLLVSLACYGCRRSSRDDVLDGIMEGIELEGIELTNQSPKNKNVRS